MAAYAALVSLMHIIEQIQHHPRPPISLDKLQVQSLTKNVTFLQDFLESYSINGGSKEADALESRIADAAYAAEDIIESHIVDQIQAGSTTTHVENISSSTEFYQGLQKVIEDMDFIKTEIKEKLAGFQDQLLHRNSMSAGSSRSYPTGQNTTVGFDDVLIEIMDKLTGQQRDRQIIPIVGMGGIDNEIRVSMLIKLWVAEGFLKPICGKSLEVVAQEYFKDLVDRNLILVRKLGRTGKIKFCTIHDLLWDLCLREARKEKFLCATRLHDISQGISTQRRICIHRSTKAQALDALQSASLARSLSGEINGVLPQFDFRLLRVWNVVDDYILDFYENLLNTYPRESIFQLVNLRFLDIELTSDQVQVTPLPSSIHLLWNLQTLIVKVYLAPKEITGALPETLGVTAPSEIWKMPQLKHVEFYELHLPEPPSGEMDGRDDSGLGNLQTLLTVRNFKCGEEVLKRIPNIKKLEIHYEGFEEWSSCCLNNVGRLRKLKTLGCFFSSEMRPSRSYLVQNLIFPHSLRKLSLGGSHLNWDDMKTKIGSLPLLEVLILYEASFIGPKWETVDGQFCSLKFLLIEKCYDLKYWTVDSTHFPRLEQLCLYKLRKLKEIPLGIGDISTLQSIELGKCSESSVISAKEILKEQEDLGNVGLQVRVILKQWNDAIQSLASHNFQVEVLKS